MMLALLLDLTLRWQAGEPLVPSSEPEVVQQANYMPLLILGLAAMAVLVVALLAKGRVAVKGDIGGLVKGEMSADEKAPPARTSPAETTAVTVQQSIKATRQPAPPNTGTMPTTHHQRPTPSKAHVAEVLSSKFNLNEMADLSMRLGVEFEEIPGDTRSKKARELVDHLARRDRLQELIGLINSERENTGLA
jgi:hypothetical protein